jgi:ATP-dependent helicase IRC3
LVSLHSSKADGKEHDGEKLSCRGLLEELPIRTFSQSVVEAYKEGAVGRKSTVVFAANLDDVGSILQAFTDAGIDAKDVSSDNTVHERDSTLKSFRKGDLAVLVNCRVLMEGCDLPAVSDSYIATPAA